MNNSLSHITSNKSLLPELKNITLKVINEERLTIDEGIFLFNADLSFLGSLANYIREKNTKTSLILIETYI